MGVMLKVQGVMGSGGVSESIGRLWGGWDGVKEETFFLWSRF